MTIAWQPGRPPYSSSTISASTQRLGDFGAILDDPEASEADIALSFRHYINNDFAATDEGKQAIDHLHQLGEVDNLVTFTKHSQAGSQSFTQDFSASNPVVVSSPASEPAAAAELSSNASDYDDAPGVIDLRATSDETPG